MSLCPYCVFVSLPCLWVGYLPGAVIRAPDGVSIELSQHFFLYIQLKNDFSHRFAILFTVIVEVVEPEVRATAIALFLFFMNQVISITIHRQFC